MGFVITGYEDRRLATQLTLTDANGNPITFGGSDKVRLQIGTPVVFEVESGTATANGSTITSTDPVVLTLVTADMDIPVGVYNADIDKFENATSEYKRIATGIFHVKESVGDECIISWADIQTMIDLGSLSVRENALVTKIVSGIESAIKSYLHYDPCLKVDRTEYSPIGEPRLEDDYLLLSHLPVRSITSIEEDADGRFGQGPTAFTGTVKTAGEDYWLEIDTMGVMSMSGHVGAITPWSCVPGSIKTVYTSGFAQDEFQGSAANGVDASGIRMAAMLTFQKLFETMTGSRTLAGTTVSGVLSGESAGDYSYTLDSSILQKIAGQTVNISPEAEMYLEPFRSYNGLGL